MLIATLVIGLITFTAADEVRSDPGQAALKGRGASWYDSKDDDFRPVLPPRPWEFSSKSSPSPAPTTTPNPGGAGPAGGWSFSLPMGSILQTLLWFALALVVLALVGWAIRANWKFSMAAGKESQEATASPARLDISKIAALPQGVSKTEDFLAEAKRLLAAGDLAGAILHYFSFQLISLDRAGHIELRKGKTNGRYERELSRNRPALLAPFGTSIRLFEDVFFGGLPIDRASFDRVWAEREKFLKLMEGRSATP
jgi:hypothetical protein